MAHGQFVVSDTNPNDTTGGGGCICDPQHQTDCTPPFAIFYGNDMESPASPHVVVCQACFASIGTAFGGEIKSAGEKGNFPFVDVELPEDQVEELDPEDLEI